HWSHSASSLWEKRPAAVFRTAASLPAAKGATFAAWRRPSVPKPQVRRHHCCVRIRVAPSAGQCAARVARLVIIVERRWRRYRERMPALALQRLVERGQLLRALLLEGARDVAELGAKRLDVGQLVAGGWSLPGGDRAVELVGVLAQPLLAGDGAAFGGGHD